MDSKILNDVSQFWRIYNGFTGAISGISLGARLLWVTNPRLDDYPLKFEVTIPLHRGTQRSNLFKLFETLQK